MSDVGAITMGNYRLANYGQPHQPCVVSASVACL